MNIAAESAARNAVGPIGLAALAVSAMIMTHPTAAQVTEPVVDCSEPPHEINSGPEYVESVVRVGEIVVVGSPDADTIVAQIRALDFAQCGWTTGHLTLYVHIRNGIVDNQFKVTCPMAVVASGTYIGDADVMIPIDFSARP